MLTRNKLLPPWVTLISANVSTSIPSERQDSSISVFTFARVGMAKALYFVSSFFISSSSPAV